MTITTRLLGVLLISLASLDLSGCGGGGGGATERPPTVVGAEYFTVLWDLVDSSFGVTTFAEGGDLTGLLTRNAAGVIGTRRVDYVYAEREDGRLAWFDFTESLNPYLLGGATASVRLATLACVLETVPTEVAVLVRRGNTFDNTALNGAYHVVRNYFRNATGSRWGVISTETYDGAGAYSTTIHHANRDGVSTPIVSLVSPTYDVASDGQVTQFSPGPSWRGNVASGGDVAILGGGLTNGSASGMKILVRKSASASNGTLSGSYTGILIHLRTVPVVRYSVHVDAQFTDGSVSMEGLVHDDLGVNPVPNSGTYQVLPDGTARLTNFTIVWRGAVSPSGDFAVFGGPEVDGFQPGIWVFVRK